MEKYQIIPRRFRPAFFREVVGQKAQVATLQNAVCSRRIGQAYLFSGGRGCGKTTLARIFAKAINCSAADPNGEPCDLCSSCLQIREGKNLDLIEIDGASHRGIEDIRRLSETACYAPSGGLHKIYLIDEVHMLTKEAFNALLKILEEPPPNVKFFFATTEPHKVPPTVMSRCQRFHLNRISAEDMGEKLGRVAQALNLDVTEEALSQICALSDGSLRDAESLLDQTICSGNGEPITVELVRKTHGLIAYHHLFELDEAIHTANLDAAAHLAEKWLSEGRGIDVCIDSLLSHFYIHLSIQRGKPISLAGYERWTIAYSKNLCLSLIDILLKWQMDLLKVPYTQIHLEMLLVALIREKGQTSLAILIERLIDLEQRIQEKVTIEKPSPAPVVEREQLCPPSNTKKEETKPIAPPLPLKGELSPVPASRIDTLIRFAAVELEGTLK